MKPLRKQHLVTWRVLAVLLPAGIILAWISVPEKISQSLLQPAGSSPLPVVLRKAVSRDYSIAIRSNLDTSLLQLEWISGKILQYPTATIYADDGITKSIGELKLIGRIEARGKWYFPLDSTFKYTRANRLILYDFIHQQVIDTINLLP